MRMFELGNKEYKYENSKSVIAALAENQHEKMTPEEFLPVIKKRLSLWTGKEVINFLDEVAVVEILVDEGIIEFYEGTPSCECGEEMKEIILDSIYYCEDCSLMAEAVNHELIYSEVEESESND